MTREGINSMKFIKLIRSHTNKIFYSFCLLLIIISILIIGIRNNGFNTFSKGIDRSEYEHVVSQYSILFANTIFQFSTTDILLDNVEVSDSKESTYNLSKILAKPCLVLRFTELNCQQCVDDAVSSLMNHVRQSPQLNAIILTSYSNAQDLYIFKHLHKIDIPIYNLGEERLQLPIEDIDTPYFFISDETLIAKEVFIPDKSINDLTSEYLRVITHKYFRN